MQKISTPRKLRTRKNQQPARNLRSYFKNFVRRNFSILKIIFFNLSGIRWPLFSYLHHNSQSLLIIFVHWTQLSEYWKHETDYMFFVILFLRCYCPCRDFLSILQSWICCVWTVSIQGCWMDHLISFLSRTTTM